LQKRLYAVTATLILSAIIPLVFYDAHAHGISTCLGGEGRCALAMNNVQYSSSVLDMNDASGGVLTITGTLKNKYSNHELRLVPYLSVDSSSSNPFGSFELNNLLRLSYPPSHDPASWYFKAESNLTSPIIIKPREEINFEIKAYPLKAGIYHVHSTFVYDYLNDGRYRYYQSTDRGNLVTVTGSSAPTFGEVTQLIVPFAIGTVAIPIAVLKGMKVKKAGSSSSPVSEHSRLRRGIRIYFAVKSSLEVVWLSGIIFWFVFVAYPAFNTLETRLASIAGMIVVISSMIAGGYIAAFAKSKKLQSAFSIGTAISSIFVYFLSSLISYYTWVNISASPYDLLPSSGVGYSYNQFEFYEYVPLIALFANSAVAILSAVSIRREMRKASKIVIAGMGILIFFSIMLFSNAI